MAIVDDRGRVAGRVNLVDAVAAVLILVMIPIAYGAYLLFRTPPATLTYVNPPRLYQGPNLRVEVQGQNLRPFMRVSFGNQQGRSYMIGSTRAALVDLPELGPGTYDVVLFDYMQEVHRLPKALTILPLAPVPTVEIVVSGAFKGLSADRAKGLKAGDKLPPSGDVVAEVISIGEVKPSELRLRMGESLFRVPMTGLTDLAAVLRVKCFVASNVDGSLRCAVAGPLQQADVAAGSALSLATASGWATFQIDEVRSPAVSH